MPLMLRVTQKGVRAVTAGLDGRTVEVTPLGNGLACAFRISLQVQAYDTREL